MTSSQTSCSSNMSFSSLQYVSSLSPVLKQQQQQEEDDNTRIIRMPSRESSISTPIPSIGQSQINRNRACLLREAKLLQDPDFDFLWGMQETMQPFAETAGGRTTFLRSLRNKLN
ncbi:unnamed protein product [Rotaria sp. Silwood2]|nr:unnamed protein product [Rotaria sp. Silwood2]CAF2942416.1 unnamed protein product [Rotaria sp. Silwood2]CAF3347771.1 unnamed protein product [Rotaria sp. Silwood2]CAF4050260.1 unnamed protein product [Rotaria sp. Silwood2]CAF4194395.1 unnamed protein product [Rotaria sp. Silwood2]